MAYSWALSVTDLKCLKGFLEHECTWQETARGDRYRQYCAMCSASTSFHPDTRGGNDGPILCQMLMLKRGDEFIFFLNINGKQFGQFMSKRVHKRRFDVTGLGRYYTFSSHAPLEVSNLAFVPQFAPPISSAGKSAIDPMFLYEHCVHVTEEDAASVMVDDVDGGQKVRLGGLCCWGVYSGEDVSIYTFVLAFDLFTSCCERHEFPSLARLCSKSTACDDVRCAFCYDHGSHVDASGMFSGCTPDTGVCLCYSTCKTPNAAITDRSFLPFLMDSDEDRAERIVVKDHVPGPLSTDPAKYVFIETADGEQLPFKNNAWQLVKLSPGLSRLLILACPILKGLMVDSFC